MEQRQIKSQLKALKQDECIISTNNSSIVSKRSVERLYYPDEPHFFRYFVKKPQRRAPLINRGYWLRMKAIEYVIHDFLKEASGRPRVVINLGSGYDPNPWQCLARFPEAYRDVTFIDVDYMALMVKKCAIVKEAVELKKMLTNLSFYDTSEVLLRSDQYIQVGCDLRDLSRLSAALASAVDSLNLHECKILFTAEVSITYMDTDAADDLIRWATALPHTRFCLLEQILPDGPNHPFARTMLAHFEKLQTPLHAARRYPTIYDQEERFRNAGWTNVRAKNLWELWSSPEFLSSDQRSALDNFEPFDEWEEFALFGSHYFLLVASSDVHTKATRSLQSSLGGIQNNSDKEIISGRIVYAKYDKSTGCRRFAAPLLIQGSNRQRDLLGNFAGIGLNARVNSCDVYTMALYHDEICHNYLSLPGPSARMCHTITDLGDAGALLTGGRTSPDNGLSDCWLYHKWINVWERVDDLPKPRYRHAAVGIGNDLVVIAGGKSCSSSIVKGFLVWSRRHGWVECTAGAAGQQPATFGGSLTTTGMYSSGGDDTITGIFMGGISRDGTISRDIWFWTLHGCKGPEPSLIFDRFEDKLSIARFGATLVRCAGHLLLLGGVTPDHITAEDQEILSVDITQDTNDAARIVTRRVVMNEPGLRPLLIGSSIYSIAENLVIMGGGAVCFSFGTFWNKGCFSLYLETKLKEDRNKRFYDNDNEIHPIINLGHWVILQSIEMVSRSASTTNFGSNKLIPSTKQMPNITSIPYRRLKSAADFSTIVTDAQPVILQELSIGNCTRIWTHDYLKNKIGGDRTVVIHKASHVYMDFKTKNFEYSKKSFGEFIDAIERGERLYLRSLSAEKPSDTPANLERDFPTIAADFQLPPELKMVAENAHSSPLRISGPVNMWLHYDVMANVLCQIRGHKQLLLFPPSDAQYFDFLPGSSSSSVDVFKMLDSADLAHAHPHEAILKPGDVLFLPALWLHAASPMESTSVAVNVFFRNLEGVYAAGRDVYGNRDLQAYEQGRRDVARIAKSFKGLPDDVRRFYLQRLADELRASR